MTSTRAPVAETELARRALAAGRIAGLAALGVTSAEPFADTRRRLEERRADGLHGSMQFTYRNPERSTDPRMTYPWARSLVAGAWGYGHPPTSSEGASARDGARATRPSGRVARYSARDHYAALTRALEAVAAVLREAGWRAAVVVDQNHLVDRAVAHRAGLGWYGKNSLVLLPGAGSWFLLGSVVTDAVLSATDPSPVADGCGTCSRCMAGCPTGAIVAPGVVDARRCLAWAVQAPGVVPRELRVAMGDRIYGCDDCQEVCPPNRVHLRRTPRSSTVITDVDPTDAPADDGATQGEWVDLLDLLAADDATLLDRHGRWYIPDRDPRALRRNALVALGNTASPQDPRVVEALRAVLDGDDDLLAAHAVWAARRLGRDDLVAVDGRETGPLVADERAAPRPPVRSDGLEVARR